MSLTLALTALAAAPLAAQRPAEGTPVVPDSVPIVTFDSLDTVEWVTVHDNVMGGVSTGRLVRTGEGTGLFSGVLSLENNGGFASVRALIDRPDLALATGLEIRVRGDGRSYQLRLRMNDRFDGIAYTISFDTNAGEWSTHRLAFADFRPTYRGRTPGNATPLDPSRVRQIGVMLADKQPGSFSLEIDWMAPWHAQDGGR
jgi:monofunctional biosynthetic peptidoglycan transglycosylase